MDAVNRFKALAAEERFKGWPLVGEVEEGAKIPFFGHTVNYKLRTGNGVEDYTSIIRSFGWSVVFGVTDEQNVVTIIQWKPGTNQANWELPPGGIGRLKSGAGLDEIRDKTAEAYLRETGYGGRNFGDPSFDSLNERTMKWTYLGNVVVESGKYRGASPDDHGLLAHMWLAENLQRMQDARKPNANEIIEVLEIPLAEFNDVIDSGLFHECSALPCALLAMRRLTRKEALR